MNKDREEEVKSKYDLLNEFKSMTFFYINEFKSMS